jgi:hypothetical protein
MTEPAINKSTSSHKGFTNFFHEVKNLYSVRQPGADRGIAEQEEK